MKRKILEGSKIEKSDLQAGIKEKEIENRL